MEMAMLCEMSAETGRDIGIPACSFTSPSHRQEERTGRNAYVTERALSPDRESFQFQKLV